MTNVADAPSSPDRVEVRAAAREASEPARVARFVPGQPDMWVFVFVEAFLFTAYFTVYVVCRTRSIDLYLQSQAHLSLGVGTFNTLALLASSWSMARCVQAAREGTYGAALRNSFLTMFFGSVFLVSKVTEWTTEIHEGNTFTTNEFFSFYYFLTALHFIHLLIGFVFLGVVVYQLWSPARRSQELVETGATYWHTIDFLWVIIFSLLYVMR